MAQLADPLTTLYLTIDDPRDHPASFPGRRLRLSDSELVCLAVAPACCLVMRRRPGTQKPASLGGFAFSAASGEALIDRGSSLTSGTSKVPLGLLRYKV